MAKRRVFDDIYQLENEYVDLSRVKAVSKALSWAVFIFVLWLASDQLLRALAAAQQAWVGQPDLVLTYSPLRLLDVAGNVISVFAKYPQAAMPIEVRVGVVICIALSIGLYARHLVLQALRNTAEATPDTRGSARVLTGDEFEEIKKLGLTIARGPYLCYVEIKRTRPWWQRIGLCETCYLRGDTEGHVLVVAPTGSGKTTCYCYQLLTTHKGSVFVFDIKGESYDNTAGYRASAEGMNSTCIRLSLSDDTPGNGHFNPLDLIRVGTAMEYQDTLELVEVINDPEGKGSESNTMSEGHFQTFAASLELATILYVLYTFPPEKRNLATVLDVLSDRGAESTEDILLKMRDSDHATEPILEDEHGNPTRQNPYIVSAATDILLMTEEARANMIATCKRYLKPYRNPLVAKATAYSDFDILDLVNQEKNLSLYLVVAPSSLTSLKPVVRLIVNVILRKLTERLPDLGEIKNRLHVLLDEFASIGKLPVFENGLQFFRGYGITCSIIIQGFNQLFALYTENEMITSACKHMIIYTPNDPKSWEKISSWLGEFTYRERVPKSGKNQEDTYRDTSRRLLFPNEVRKMPRNRALVFNEGTTPIYGYKKAAHPRHKAKCSCGKCDAQQWCTCGNCDREFNYRVSFSAPVKVSDRVIQTLRNSKAPDSAADFAVDLSTKG